MLSILRSNPLSLPPFFGTAKAGIARLAEIFSIRPPQQNGEGVEITFVVRRQQIWFFANQTRRRSFHHFDIRKAIVFVQLKWTLSVGPETAELPFGRVPSFETKTETVRSDPAMRQ